MLFGSRGGLVKSYDRNTESVTDILQVTDSDDEIMKGLYKLDRLVIVKGLYKLDMLVIVKGLYKLDIPVIVRGLYKLDSLVNTIECVVYFCVVVHACYILRCNSL